MMQVDINVATIVENGHTYVHVHLEMCSNSSGV